MFLAACVFAGALLFSTFSAVPASAYADGAPPGFSGGFGEQACDACHFDNDINVKPGQLTLTGVPERFTPGQQYTVTVTLARPEMKVGGFQLTARMVNGGAQAGTFGDTPGDAKRVRVSVFSANLIQYVQQSREGAGPATPGILRWEVVWTAPAMPGSVMFHASGNAGNGDEFAGGDYVYTAVATVAGSR